MTITISIGWIPWIITIILFCFMFRPYQQHGDYDFGIIFRLFYLIPIGFIWAIYFAILYFLKK